MQILPKYFSQHDLRRDREYTRMEISRRHAETETLKSEISRLQIQIDHDSFTHRQLDDDFIALNNELAFLTDSIDQIDERKSLRLAGLEQDYNGEAELMRLELENQLVRLQTEITLKAEKCIKNTMEHSLQEIKLCKQKVEDQLDRNAKHEEKIRIALLQLHQDHKKLLESLSAKLDTTIKLLREEVSRFNSEQNLRECTNAKLETQINDTNQELSKYEAILSQIKDESAEKDAKLILIENQILCLRETTLQITQLRNDQELEIENLVQETARINISLKCLEEKRRTLHNRLQELKGNIRVFCRIRPIGECAGENEIITHLSVTDLDQDGKETVVIRNPKVRQGSQQQEIKFHFDKVFSSLLHNTSVFSEIAQLVQSCLDGYNVCIFAYGQTGLGKTFTMSHALHGIIPLSLNKIFLDIKELRSDDWTYSIHGRFIEIYNESIVDLLAPSESAKYEIKHDDSLKTTLITNVRLEPLASSEQARNALSFATKNRKTASTKSNERSSRSHFIFTVSLVGENTSSGNQCRGSLNMIDLAGLERLASSQAKGDRLKETQAINKSLSSLGDVIYALGNQQALGSTLMQHIPYRNSKLTFLLKHSLGGNSKTLMFVNVSPLEQNYNETMNSLRFATKVNATKLG